MGAFPFFVEEVYSKSIDVGMEVSILVQSCFLFPPVVFVQSVLHQVLHVLQVDPAVPASAWNHIGPARSSKTFSKIIQDLLRYVDRCGADAGGHSSRIPVDSRVPRQE